MVSSLFPPSPVGTVCEGEATATLQGTHSPGVFRGWMPMREASGQGDMGSSQSLEKPGHQGLRAEPSKASRLQAWPQRWRCEVR